MGTTVCPAKTYLPHLAALGRPVLERRNCGALRDFARLAPEGSNVPHWMLTVPAARHVFGQTSAEEARRIVSVFGAADDLWPGDAAVGALVDQIRARCLEFNAWWAEHGVGASISVFSLVRAIRDRGVDRCPFNVGPRLGRDRACTRRPDTGQKGGYHVLVYDPPPAGFGSDGNGGELPTGLFWTAGWLCSSVSTLSGTAPAYFHEQFHQPEDRSAIRVRPILL